MLAVAAAFGALYGCRLGMDERTRSPHERALCLDKPGRCSGETGLFVFAGSSPDLASDDLVGAATTLADADVVGLGEAAHGSAGFIGIKVRLSRYLVEHHGFRVIAFESNRVATRRLDAYVQTCKGDPTEALASLHKYWVDVQTRDLVQWLCQWNHQHPSDRVHVYGYDVQATCGPQCGLGSPADVGVQVGCAWRRDPDSGQTLRCPAVRRSFTHGAAARIGRVSQRKER
jgi:Erythromycin esterase